MAIGRSPYSPNNNVWGVLKKNDCMQTSLEMTTTSKQIDYKQYYNQGYTWEEYLQRFDNEMQSGDSPFSKYLPQNWRRQSRLAKKTELNDDLRSMIAKLQEPVNWLVITEHWCGDASQINPILHKVAQESDGKINLRFVYRDENEALIDAHLTDGRSRSIPIVLQLDSNYAFLASYGPRPEEAQQLVKSILAEGGNYNLPLHSWYAKNKQASIKRDLVSLLERAS